MHLDNTLLNIMSEYMDCTEMDTKWRRSVAVRCLNLVGEKLGYSAPMWPSLRRMMGHTLEMCFLIFIMYAVCACSAI